METAFRSARRHRRHYSARLPSRRLMLETLENRRLLASDGFESGGFSGGTGWLGAWTATPAATVVAGGQHSGTRHALLTSSLGDLQRAVDVSNLTDVHLQFWSKQNSFEGNDKALVSVSPNGSTWTTLLQLNKNQSDNTYRHYDLPVSTSGNTLYIRFDAAMSATDDYWYIDDVAVTARRRSRSASCSTRQRVCA
jgi:hypothetical protein